MCALYKRTYSSVRPCDSVRVELGLEPGPWDSWSSALSSRTPSPAIGDHIHPDLLAEGRPKAEITVGGVKLISRVACWDMFKHTDGNSDTVALAGTCHKAES